MILARLALWDGATVHVDENGAPMTWPPAGAIFVGVDGQTAYALIPGEESLVPPVQASPAATGALAALAEAAQVLSGPDAVLALVAGVIEDVNSRLVSAGLDPMPAASDRLPVDGNGGAYEQL